MKRFIARAIPLTLVALATALPARAAVLIESIAMSSDTSVVVDSGVASDDVLIDQSFAGGITTRSLGLPEPADLVGLHRRDDDAILVAVDTTVVLPSSFLGTPGEITALPNHVLLYSEGDFGNFQYIGIFVGSFAGVPDGVAIDAVSEIGRTLYLSFDTSAEIGVVDSVQVDDEDVVAYDPSTNRFTLFLDGSSEGIAEELDVDAVHVLPPAFLADPATLLLSFDGSGVVGGVAFDDEDVLHLEPGPGDLQGVWTMVYDGSEAAPALWADADLDALDARLPNISITPFATATPTSTPTATPTATPTRTSATADTPTATPTSTSAVGDSPTATPTMTSSLSDTPTATPTTTPNGAMCIGDCDGNGVVTIDELVRGVNIALGRAAVDTCRSLDRDGDGRISIGELIAAVNNALDGC